MIPTYSMFCSHKSKKEVSFGTFTNMLSLPGHQGEMHFKFQTERERFINIVFWLVFPLHLKDPSGAA